MAPIGGFIHRPFKLASRLTTRLPLRYNKHTLIDTLYPLDTLWDLLSLDSPSGDEGPVADWLEHWVAHTLPDARLERLGDTVLVRRGAKPTVAVFAHSDTTGWTLGYDKQLIPIGDPSGKVGDHLRPAGRPDSGNTLIRSADGVWKLKGKMDALPGSNWVYSDPAAQKSGEVQGPYLDNRGGVWAALTALIHCPEICAAFTTGEEESGGGAIVCARRLYETDGITQALIADLTWHTKHVKCGGGAAISLRDNSLPRRRYLARVLALAEESGLPFQREIESSGGSDGGAIGRSGVPMDWVFVGAPEKAPHTAKERVQIADLQSMATMFVYLVNGLSGN